MKYGRQKEKSGFTLIELIISMGVFGIIAVIGIGALVNTLDANREARAFQIVFDNINAALEDISRNMRVGMTYQCYGWDGGTALPQAISTPTDCVVIPGSGITFEKGGGGGNPATPTDQIIYRLKDSTIDKSTDGGATFTPITNADAVIESLKIYVYGSCPRDSTYGGSCGAAPGFPNPLPQDDRIQPTALIFIRGHVNAKGKPLSFALQTTVTQRVFDGE